MALGLYRSIIAKFNFKPETDLQYFFQLSYRGPFNGENETELTWLRLNKLPTPLWWLSHNGNCPLQEFRSRMYRVFILPPSIFWDRLLRDRGGKKVFSVSFYPPCYRKIFRTDLLGKLPWKSEEGWSFNYCPRLKLWLKISGLRISRNP